MKIITNYSRLKERVKDPVLAIGNFDGVHFGHQTILRTAVEEAKRIGCTPVALSFQPHPLMVLTPDKCPLFITPFQKKAELIEECGIKILLSVSFTKEFSKMRARAFAEDVLYKEIGTKEVFVGKNFTFGWDREGDSSTLRVLGEEIGFKVNIVESFKIDDITVSSSNIRKLVGEGKIREAKSLLGRYHCIKGEVIPGDKRGARLGFPTANIKITGFLLPDVGVYSSKIKLDNRVLGGITYIGSNPTFQRGSLLVESHIFDFDEDLYGKTIEVSFAERIRGEEVFESEQDLVGQISRDIEKARSFIDENNTKG
jgi:riboflavin kinase / FMN adenylyltransferase